MRTARLLPVSPSMHQEVPAQGCTWPGGVPTQGVYLPKGSVPAQGVYLPRGVYLPGGGGYLPRSSLPVDRQTRVKT